MKNMPSLATSFVLLSRGISQLSTGRVRVHRFSHFGKICVASVLMTAAISLHAAILTVTSLADSGPGTLRQMVGTSAAGDTIQFAINGTISINSTINITHTVTIQGPGPAALVVDGGGLWQIFTTSGNPVTLSGMTIANGFVQGAYGADSTGSTPAQGGGFAAGAAIFDNNGNDVLVISNCWFTGNTVIGGNGGDGQPTTNDALIDGAGGGNGSGGAIYSFATVWIYNSTFSSNSAIGGLGGDGADGSLTDDILYKYSKAGVGGVGGNSAGGALFDPSFCYCFNCTFYNNTAAGGAGGPGGTLTYVGTIPVTIEGGMGGDGASGAGGAIYGPVPPSSFTCCTIISNQAFGGSGGPGGNGVPLGEYGPNGEIGGGIAGGVYAYSLVCEVAIADTILADNYADMQYSNYFVLFADQGYNFIGSDDTYPHSCWGDTTQKGTIASPIHPLLAAPAQNGGGLPTLAPLYPISPVIDQGSNFGFTIDERGAPRPYDFPQIPNAPGGDGSDIGAVELSPPLMACTVDTHRNVIISWPSIYGSFTLQSAPDLPGTNGWSDVSYPVLLVGNQFTVTFPMTNGNQFFRLDLIQ